MTTAHALPPSPTKPPPPLPELRQDLRLVEAPADLSGAPRWLIHDPLQHRFISIGRKAHVLIQLWRPGATAVGVAEEAWSRFAEAFEPAEIERFGGFLQASGLTLEAAGGGWRGYFTQAERRRSALGSRLLHNYLFFRVPLFAPDRFLQATLAAVRPLGTVGAALVVAVLGLAGLYLVSREWDAFLATMADAFSVQGVLLLAVALPAVKLLHELGHAYTAKHFGCRVPVIGVAFVLGFPMLYADVTDTWRLKSRRQRVLVDVAGIMVDLGVACVATFLWAFMPPGPLKSLAFSLATAGWLLSLGLNLNPFMKFDGYHIAADLAGLENMQDRAMGLARWRLREVLFGLGLPPPEALSRRQTRWLVLYGWAVWIYRLVLFTGIALAVYAYFFKLAGVVLFLVEIGYFIAAPLWRELREWTRMRKAIMASARAVRRTAITGCVALGLVGALVVPWSSSVSVPAVLEAGGLARIYPGVAAQVRQVHVASGRSVAAGDVLVTLASPALMQELNLTERRTELVALRQSRRASDSADRDQAVVLDQEHIALQERRAGLLQLLRELEIRAPFAGEVVEMAPALHAGRWINLKEPVFVVRASQPPVVRGYLEAAAVWRVADGASGRFVPDDVALPTLAAQVSSIAQASSAVLEQIELVANFGGRIAAHLDAKRQPVPASAQYNLRATVTGDIAPPLLARTVPGVLVLDGRPESIVARIWRQALKVLVRESGI